MLFTFHSGTRKLKKISPAAKSVAAKQAGGTLCFYGDYHHKIARGQVKALENVDNVERRINVGENVSELSRKTFVNITSH